MADKFEEISKSITNAAEKVTKKTEAFIEMQKLRGQIHSARRSVQRNYKDLGEIIFNRYAAGETVDEEIAIICEEISQIQADIGEYREDLARKKGCRVCASCDAEVPEDAMYCMKCGSMMPEEDNSQKNETDAAVTEEEAEAAAEVEDIIEEAQEEAEVSVEEIFDQETENEPEEQ